MDWDASRPSETGPTETGPSVLPTGASADYVSYVLYGKQYKGSGYGPDRPDWIDYPNDIGDFDRCYRFLEANGALGRIGEMVFGGTQWRGIVSHWNELVELYRNERQSIPRDGGCGQHYAFNRRLDEIVVRDFQVDLEVTWIDEDGEERSALLDGRWSWLTDLFYDDYVQDITHILRSGGLCEDLIAEVLRRLGISKKDFSNKTKEAIYDSLRSQTAGELLEDGS